MNHSPEVIVAGHICLDLIPEMSTSSNANGMLFRPGALIETGRAVISTGGAVSNTGLALHRLGVSTRLMGKVGDDLFGRAILELIGGYDASLANGMIVAPHEESSYSIVLNSPGTDRIFLHHPGANDTFSADDVRYSELCGARLFHFGYPPLMKRMYIHEGIELKTLFQRVKQLGLTTSLDMAMPDPEGQSGKADWRRVLQNVLPYVDVFMPSFEEILFMMRRELFDTWRDSGNRYAAFRSLHAVFHAISQELLDMGAGIVCLKLGENGLYVRTGDEERLQHLGAVSPVNREQWADREMWVPCFKTTVVGTTGSGDATIAGFLTGLLKGMAPEDCLTSAVAVGACSVERLDAVTGIIPWAAVQERIAAGWERLPPVIHLPEEWRSR
jgi:sugar/nucleoside kinase (ribokinase family)